jgi:hypothetical protein
MQLKVEVRLMLCGQFDSINSIPVSIFQSVVIDLVEANVFVALTREILLYWLYYLPTGSCQSTLIQKNVLQKLNYSLNMWASFLRNQLEEMCPGTIRILWSNLSKCRYLEDPNTKTSVFFLVILILFQF